MGAVAWAMRQRPVSHPQSQHIAFTVDHVEDELSVATPMHLMPSGENGAHTLGDVLVHPTEGYAIRAAPKTVLCSILDRGRMASHGNPATSIQLG
jgi:hypothetical protein